MRTVHTLVAFALLCSSFGSRALAQDAFIDDAGRRVLLPRSIDGVFAAGAPAEVLLYTLVPEMLAGRNHLPSAAAQVFMPPAYRTPTPIVNLPDRDDRRYDAELLALDVDLYIDYGTVDDDYVSALEAITGRTDIPGIILDGALTNIANVYRRLGAALGVPERGERLAAEAERIIDRYRGVLGDPPVRVYLACSANGLIPCLEDRSSGEVARLLGAVNVAGSTAAAPRRPLTLDEIKESAPDIIIAASRDAAAAMRADPAWQQIPAVAEGCLYAPPELPFGWGPRPPSVNRLPGLIWLAYVGRGRPFDAAFDRDVRGFFEMFYHVTLTPMQVEQLVGASSLAHSSPPGCAASTRRLGSGAV